MGLTFCPECGARISSKARTCPQCGYFGADSSRPISEQTQDEITPTEYEIQAWVPENDEEAPLNRKIKGTIARFLSIWDRFSTAVPEIAQIIERLCAEPHMEYRAKLTPYLRQLMKDGKLQFKLDKQGELMAILQDGDNIIRKQVRLEAIELAPDIAQTVGNLTTTAYLTQILGKIQEVQESIDGLHIEIQDDRLAIADAARDQFIQAQVIQDSRLREMAILNAIATATEAKQRLMRNFAHNRSIIEDNSGKSWLELLLPGSKSKNLNVKANDALNDIRQIAITVQVECAGWSALGSYPSIGKSLSEFRKFIERQKLDDTDMLLLINEHADKDWTPIITGFSAISRQIASYTKTGELPASKPHKEITQKDTDVDEESEER